MPFINSQDPGAPRVTVYICCSLKTRALKIYSNLEGQLHFHSLTPHLRLAQSYTWPPEPPENAQLKQTYLQIWLFFFFLQIRSSDATDSAGQWKKISRKDFLTWRCYCHVTFWAGEPEWKEKIPSCSDLAATTQGTIVSGSMDGPFRSQLFKYMSWASVSAVLVTHSQHDSLHSCHIEGFDSARKGCRNAMCGHRDHCWLFHYGQQSCPTEGKYRIPCAETSKKALNYPTLCWRQAADIPSHLTAYFKDGLGFRVRIFPLISLGTSESGS